MSIAGKLAQNWDTFGALLKSTDDKPIVEESKKDDFWGAYPRESGILVGGNVLGRLLMELQRELLGPGQESLRAVDPPGIGDFLLLGREIGTISARDATFAASQPPAPVELRGAERAPLPFEAEPRDDVGPRTDVLDQDPRIAKYLTREELLELGKLGVRLSQTGVQLSRELSRNEFRGLWHLVGALNRRRPRTEDWVNWLVGDWANAVSRVEGEGVAERIISEEQEAYSFSQHILTLSGATLMALQWTELAVDQCVRLLQDAEGAPPTADVFSVDDTKRRRTLGQLNRVLQNRQLFIDEFEKRMDRFVTQRNRFAHRALVERLPSALAEHEPRMQAFQEIESFLLDLLREARDVGRVFKGLLAAIGLSVATREKIEAVERLVADWKPELDEFLQVKR